MIKNYFTIALRVLFRNKIYPLINLTGLSVGLASALFILIYVNDELSYDKFHEKADRIYRSSMLASFSGQSENIGVTPNVIVPFFSRELPEIEKGVRVYNRSMFNPIPVQMGDKQFQEHAFFYADSTFFDVFSFPMLEGDINTALKEPNSLVLTESTAIRYFGANWRNEEVLGKTMKVLGKTEMQITGIIENVPRNSHFTLDLLASYNTLKGYHREEVWGNANFYSYFLLKEGTDVKTLNDKIEQLILKEKGEEFKAMGISMNFPLHALTDIHLRINIEDDIAPQGDISYIYIFGFIAIVIVLIACINYMNLATARASLRAREIGVRKVLGAGKRQLVWQFLGEAILLSMIGCTVALLIDIFLLPFFNDIAGKAFSYNDLLNFETLTLVYALGLLVGILAGVYPAVYLATFNIQKSLKGKLLLQPSGAIFRKSLVVLQFGISIFMVISTVIVFTQLQYFQNKNLGFNKEEFLIIPINERAVADKIDVLKNEFNQISQVSSIAITSEIPGTVSAGYLAAAEGLPENQNPIVNGLSIDPEFVPSLNLDVLYGKNFKEGYTSEEGYQYIINETAARKLGWTPETAVGKWLDLIDDRKGDVIGVVKDFHFTSLHTEINPLVMFVETGSFNYMLVKIKLDDLSNTLDKIENGWHKIHPTLTFDLAFLDKEYEALYRAEQRTGTLFGIFSVLSIFIAMLGLIGLAAFTAEQKHKEIGIRKVLGASVSSIVFKLSNEYTLLVLISFALSAPIAWWIMRDWLANFAYQASIGWWVYVLAGFFSFAVTWLTVSFQSIKAAILNPVDTLREE